MKNDILTQNLPTRFVFSESLYSGFEPYWNPYINFGTPQYGDMNNGFWNPVQWLIGSTSRYSIYSITLEEMFYVLIGGWGIYLVAKEFFHKDIALITGLTYMCCGYLTGHLQFLCWVTGTAYFPYVLLYFIRINKAPIVKNFLLGGISVFFFLASTHPGLVIGAAYFFAFLLLAIFFNRKNFFAKYYHPKIFQINFLFLCISCVLSMVVIYSNLDVLQHISRGSKVSLEQSLWHPTTLQSYISLFLPLPVHKSGFFNTDISMRNAYIGIAHLAGLVFLFRSLKRRLIFWIIIPLLFFVLLSSGGYFKMLAWKFIPLTGFVRLNGEFTYFVTLILLFCGASGMQQIFNNKKNILLPRFLTGLLIFCGVTMLIAIGGILITHSSITFRNIVFIHLKDFIHFVVDYTSFWDLLLVQAIIQAITIFLLKKHHIRPAKVFLILCSNLIVCTWLTLPFTGLGNMSKKDVQTVIDVFPRGIGVQPLLAINEATYIKPLDDNQFLLISSYSKKIGHPRPDQYPVQLNNSLRFYNDSVLYNFIKTQSYLFLSTDTINSSRTNFDSTHISVIKSGPGYIKCIVKNDVYSWLTLLQNNYPFWKVKIDGRTVNHFTGFKTFITLPVAKGEHTIEFSFKPVLLKGILWINLLFIFVAIIICITPHWGQLKIFK
ncbi:MAG TPA: hypothetical protein VF487_05085 [Chitinophagaceae bacterium]